MLPVPHVVRRGTGTPLVFVHGNGVDHRMLLDLDDAFADGPWERLHIGLPGFGLTPPLDGAGGLPELADWLGEAAEELTGGRPFAVVGASLGGLLARDLAARNPGRCVGMALLVPVVDSVRAHRTVPPHEVLVSDPVLIASLGEEDAAGYTALAVLQTPENWEGFRRSVLPGVRAANLRAMARLERAYALPELPDARLDGFAGPVLIVAGRQDAVVGFEDQWALARRFPHATFAVLDRAGHNLTVDAREPVVALLREWSARAAAAAS